MSYESIKKFLSDHRMHLGMIASLVLVFFAGVGTGRLTGVPGENVSSNYTNYTTKKAVEDTPTPAAKAEGGGEVVTDKPLAAQPSPAPTGIVAAATTAGSPERCVIKGNISGKNKIYHVAGGSFYDRVNPEQCFETEAAAQTAGFRKSTR